MKYKLSIVVALAMLPTPSIASESFICIEEQKTGYLFSDGEWVASRFQLGKWLVSTEENGKVSKFGTNYIRFPSTFGKCRVYDSELECSGPSGNFRMSFNTMRFLSSYSIGYVRGDFEHNDTPNLAIGTCAPM